MCTNPSSEHGPLLAASDQLLPYAIRMGKLRHKGVKRLPGSQNTQKDLSQQRHPHGLCPGGLFRPRTCSGAQDSRPGSRSAQERRGGSQGDTSRALVSPQCSPAGKLLSESPALLLSQGSPAPEAGGVGGGGPRPHVFWECLSTTRPKAKLSATLLTCPLPDAETCRAGGVRGGPAVL